MIEMVVAIGILGMVFFFASTIFKAGIGSYRTASAQAEIMQKLRAMTQQLDSDFQGLQKDGYLLLYCENNLGRTEYPGAEPNSFRTDRMYYFSTGDFQSWFNPAIKSNIARIYLGHEHWSLYNMNIPVNHWRLAHDVLLLSSGAASSPDVNTGISYAQCKANPTAVLDDANLILTNPPEVDTSVDPNTIRRLFCEHAGQFRIDWTDGSINSGGAIAWFGLLMPRKVGDPGNGIPADPNYYASIDPIEPVEPVMPDLYKGVWQPSTPQNLWPKAIKFTFTIYDSRGVFKEGQTFTHIVYLGE